MSAVTIKTTCMACGDIELDADQVLVIAPATYVFWHCQLEHERTNQRAASVLDGAGVYVVDLNQLDAELRELTA